MFYTVLPEEVIEKFSRSRSICILTGAGISIACGVPSYRGSGRAGYFQGLPADYLSSKDAWQQRPEIVNKFFDEYRALIHAARPGIAHQAIHGWELRRFIPAPLFQFTLITHNFDGLHQLIGNEEVIELHGSIWRVRCSVCHFITELAPFRLLPPPKACTVCDGKLRPDVRLIDEQVPTQIHQKVLSAAQNSDIFLAIGVSGVTRYSALLAGAARRNNNYLIEINPKPTFISHFFDVSILARAEDVLPIFYWDYISDDSFIV